MFEQAVWLAPERVRPAYPAALASSCSRVDYLLDFGDLYRRKANDLGMLRMTAWSLTKYTQPPESFVVGDMGFHHWMSGAS